MSKGLFAVVGAVAILGFAFPSVFQRYQAEMADEAARDEVVSPAPMMQAASDTATPAPAGRVAALKAHADGHFRAEARFNGRGLPVLVDTGATYVSISEDNARRLGLALKPSDFRFKAETANGPTDVAMAVLDRVQIGRVEVRDVEAIVSRGDVLPVTLLGMSFLNKLKRFSVEGETLNLVQ
jgi:aspartyl protease family protein